MSSNNEVPVNIEKIVYHGWGLSRLESGIVFVPHVIEGETALITIPEPNSRFRQAGLIEIINPARERIEPTCQYFTICGGCQYQHMAYAYQLKIKR